jgi:hypothetical protein
MRHYAPKAKTLAMQSNSAALPELAFYYPNPMWLHGDWIKNLLLFFDGVALLVPDYMCERPYELDPALVSGLEEAGLLEILEPETFIDKTAAEGLATAMTDLLASGALDGIPLSGEFTNSPGRDSATWQTQASLRCSSRNSKLAASRSRLKTASRSR